jgi:uncharacterized membrane protein
VLDQYERTFPGAAGRILALTEEQLRSRMGLEERTVVSAIRSETRGQWFAFITVIAGLGVGAALVASDHNLSGLASMLTPLGIVAGSFIYARRAQEREREQKRLALERARIANPA